MDIPYAPAPDEAAPVILTEVGPAFDIADLPPEMRGKMVAATSDVPQHVDFFDVQETYKAEFPDGVQCVYVRVMSEGDRKRYQNKTNREIRMNASTREMKMKSAAGDDRHELLKIAISGWNIYRAGSPWAFNPNNLEQALNAWPPSIVDLIEKKVAEVNPWIKGTDENLPAMREEYEELGKRIQQLEDRAAKN